MSDTRPAEDLKKTPLHDLHLELGGRMVPFAGWSMPVQYPSGILAEHNQCRRKAALFDVSHMGQLHIVGDGAAERMETLVPGEIRALKPGRARYTMLTNDEGGIRDDLIVTRTGNGLFVVVNAGCRDADTALIRAAMEPDLSVAELADRALLALQGPAAATVLGRLCPEVADLAFMQSAEFDVSGLSCRVSRLGYTGEDGYEISVHADHAVKLARTLLAAEEVEPAGLGARDSLRLEAGLCLYGHDIDTTTTPIEAGLRWTIGKRRAAEGGFPGHERILAEMHNSPERKLVGLRPDGRAPVREGAEVQDRDGHIIGKVTSGAFGPTVGGPVAMGYLTLARSQTGETVNVILRGKPVPATVTAMPFVPHNYHRKEIKG
ncbi:MAG: glycine cleavage system aminomethyltransferase GcvT [Geminicoccaceae bacterium]|nr:glycine cleavage system aminomethyltransferase GcvT [Geminicoccaceae bacterium]